MVIKGSTERSPQFRKVRWQPKTLTEKRAVFCVSELRKQGHEAYFVGGYPRDLLLKRTKGDIDITTSATPKQIENTFRKYRTINRDKRYGTIRVIIGRTSLEVTTYRMEQNYEDRRRPKDVRFVKSAQQDVARRDLTINGLLFDPIETTIIDYVDGLKDIQKITIRFIGDADKRVKEDSLRMLRAVRFEAVLGFVMSRSARAALRRNAKLIDEIAVERIRDELDKIMMSENASVGFGLLKTYRLLPHILPDLNVLSQTKQEPEFHGEGDVFTHSLMVLELIPVDADIAVRWAGLLHDIGKHKTTKRIVRNGVKRYVSYNHEVVGAEMISQLFGENGLKFDNMRRSKMRWLIRNHMILFQLKDMREAKRLRWTTHKWFPELLTLYKADSLARITSDQDPLKSWRYAKCSYANAQKILKGKTLEEHFRSIVTGNDIKEVLNVTQGPKVGNILREMRELFFQGRIRTRKQALRYLENKAKGIKGNIGKTKS